MNPDDPMAQWRNRLLGASRGITNGLLGASRAIASGARGLGREFASDPMQAYQDYLRGGASSALELARFMPGESRLERGLLSAADKVGPEQRSAHSLLGGFVGDVIPDIMNADAIVAPGRMAEAEGPVMKALEASAFLPVVPGGLLGRAMRRVDDLPEAGGLLRMGEPTPARVPGQVDTGMSGTWYSRLESAIESAPQPRATAAQWRGMIRKGQGGVGKTEMEWTGIERALEDAGDRVLTKEEVLGMARERPVGLSEEVFGASTGGYDEAVAHADRNRFYSGKGDMPDDEWRALSDRVRSYDDVDNAPGASFSKWTQGEWGLNPEANSREIRVTLDGSDYVPSPTHKTPPGELVRIRTTDRQVNGDNTLFIEEIQSDWHQAGRERGYNDATAKARAAEIDTEMEALFRDPDYGNRTGSSRSDDLERQARALREERDDLQRGTVPDAPFKKTEEWVALSLRRALQEAAEGGYDRLAWVSGEQAADLYDLRKQVSRIEWDAEDGLLRAFGHDGNVVVDEVADTPERLAEFIGKDPARRLVEQEVPGIVYGTRPVGSPSTNPVSVFASKAEADAAVQRMQGMEIFETPNTFESTNVRTIEGDDLAVGGEGMDTFYNRIVPNVVKKEAKRLGVTIEPVSLAPKLDEGRLPEGYELVEDYDFGRDGEQVPYFEVQRYTTPGMADSLGEGSTAEKALQAAVANSPELRALTDAEPTNLSIRITPEARRNILKEGTNLAGFGGIGLLGANFARQQRERAAEQNNSRGLLN